MFDPNADITAKMGQHSDTKCGHGSWSVAMSDPYADIYGDQVAPVGRKLASHRYRGKHLEMSQLPAGAGSPVVCFANANFARFFARFFADLATLRTVGG